MLVDAGHPKLSTELCPRILTDVIVELMLFIIILDIINSIL